MKNTKSILAVILVISLLLVIFFTFLSDFAGGVDGIGQTPEGYTIVFSEICPKNETIIADNDGKHRDYIELYNPGEPVDLTGFTFTDGRGTSAPLDGLILGTDEYRTFFFSKETTGFSIGSSGGDCIQLLDPYGRIVVQAVIKSCMDDQVMLYRNGIYEVSANASPGFPNTPAGLSAFRTGQEDEAPQLVISEVLINNAASLPDSNGFFPDAIELHNLSDTVISLDGYFLSDSMEDRFQFRLPNITLPADGYAVVFCDKGNFLTDSGEIHANFSISHNETLVLTNTTGAYTAVTARSLGDDRSLNLTDTGEYVAGNVSLGFDNTEEGIYLFLLSNIDYRSPLVISEFLDSSADAPYSGSIQDVVEILNRSGNTVSTEGWYLSDGSDPYTYPLPTRDLAPGERMVVVCSPDMTGFSVSEGESVLLFGPTYQYAPPVVCTAGDPGMSMSMLEDLSSMSYHFSDITLGYENTAKGHELYCRDQLPKGLMITEVMTANQSYLKGAYATTSDWVEILNTSDSPIDLAGHCLSNDPSKLNKYTMPDITLQPGEYCIIFLSSDPTNLLKGYPVIPFSLSSSGGQLYLSLDDTVLDHVHIPALSSDLSYGRSAGSAAFSLLSDVTPGKANGAAAEMTASPMAETPQGIYDDVGSVVVVLSGVGNIYYTTDCTAPTTADKLYTGPITLTETTVLRVMCQEPGKLPSDVIDLTYLINEYNPLPSVSVVAEPDDLWSAHSGIYVAGPNPGTVSPYYGANYWKDWEKESSLSLFELDGNGFSAKCGVKIFGAFTRVNSKKSLAFHFRDTYGTSELAYPIFGEDSLDTYEAIILRTAGQDAFQGRMRDVVLTSLMGEYTDIPVQDYRPVVVYLNGKYWGLHYIREKLNENYVAGHFNVPAETVTVVEGAGWLSPEYRALVSFVLKNDMSVEENYAYVCSQMDVDSYIDMIIAQIWCANTDNGNIRFYRIDDGKWTWFFFDTDLALRNAELNTIYSYLTLAGLDTTDIACRTFVAKMMSHDEFREKFLTRLAWQMNTIWTEENVLGRINEIETIIQPIMVRECETWDANYRNWEIHLDMMKNFASDRNQYLLTYIQEFFGFTAEEMRAYGFNV